ncbi:MAG: hypothetical protein WBX17_01385 [Microbacterium sp.]
MPPAKQSEVNAQRRPHRHRPVTDDKVAASQIRWEGSESNVVAGPLEPGASITCRASATAAPGPYVNTGTALAEVPALGTTVTDGDPSHYTDFASRGR